MTQTVKKRRTLIRFAVERTTYRTGEGSTTAWEPITVRVGTDENGNAIVSDCFYCEWRGSYGTAAIQQQADGILQPARIRMPYVRAVYEALTTKRVRVYKNGITDEAHTYELSSAADNYMNADKMLEFQVRKQEVK